MPTTVTTLATAAPTKVPVTPKKDATTVALTAASALATSWVSDSLAGVWGVRPSSVEGGRAELIALQVSQVPGPEPNSVQGSGCGYRGGQPASDLVGVLVRRGLHHHADELLGSGRAQ